VSGALRVVVTPRDDNPYLDLLYREMEHLGVVSVFPDGPSGSQSLNLLLSPLTLAWYRAKGYSLLHIHWLFKFSLPWARRSSLAGRVMERWLALYLGTARALGYRIVWTAHDLVPHEPIFFDDDRARALLIRRCDLVIALSPSSARTVAGLGARQVRVVPLGSFALTHRPSLDRAGARRRLGLGEDEVVVAWIGKVAPYKGVDLLLEAVARLPEGSSVRAIIAGACPDKEHHAELCRLVEKAGERALVRLERISDEELGTYLLAADLAAFPFREITNSSSVLTALAFGVPVIVPDLEGLADVAEGCVLRYDPAHEDLAEVLERAAALSPRERQVMGEVGLEHANSRGWESIAQAMLEAYRDLAATR